MKVQDVWFSTSFLSFRDGSVATALLCCSNALRSRFNFCSSSSLAVSHSACKSKALSIMPQQDVGELTKNKQEYLLNAQCSLIFSYAHGSFLQLTLYLSELEHLFLARWACTMLSRLNIHLS